MGKHTEAYRLVVTDHVKGREGIASDVTAWAEDPETAIYAYHQMADRQVDGTTVELLRVETTSVMSAIKGARTETVQRYADKPSRIPPGHFGKPVTVAGTDTVPVSITPAMARMLLLGRDSGYRVPADSQPNIGTVRALIDRELLLAVRHGADPHRLTDRGAVLADLLDVENRQDPSWFQDGPGSRTYSV